MKACLGSFGLLYRHLALSCQDNLYSAGELSWHWRVFSLVSGDYGGRALFTVFRVSTSTFFLAKMVCEDAEALCTVTGDLQTQSVLE